MQIASWGGVRGPVRSLSLPAFSTDIRQRLCASDERRASRRGSSRGSKCLVVGNLRSYGDEVVCESGRYVQTTLCDRVLNIDLEKHTVTAESGIRLDVLERRLRAHGYVMPVTPGTAFVTLGGAIANDVHGKNHHSAGTFGCFVERFELMRTGGEVLRCSAAENAELFAGTIGGMGLTGAISWATIRLRSVASTLLRVASRRFQNLAQFFDPDWRGGGDHEYSVAWIDCLARGAALGRGIYSTADHVPAGGCEKDGRSYSRRGVGVPIELSVSPVNRFSLSAINALYFGAHRTRVREVQRGKWLHPLDAVAHWNRLYGRSGFYQFQCVVPPGDAEAAVSEMLRTVAASRQGSFLAVLKDFGGIRSPGLMSFPMPGTTLALDFPNRGEATRGLLLLLHRIAADARGRLYPAKDACSPPDSLEQGYPNFARFRRLIDPGIESVMARRLRLID